MKWGWPSYLAVTIGAVSVVELLYDVLGLSDASVLGAVAFIIVLIVLDFFEGELPSQERDTEANGG